MLQGNSLSNLENVPDYMEMMSTFLVIMALLIKGNISVQKTTHEPFVVTCANLKANGWFPYSVVNSRIQTQEREVFRVGTTGSV